MSYRHFEHRLTKLRQLFVVAVILRRYMRASQRSMCKNLEDEVAV